MTFTGEVSTLTDHLTVRSKVVTRKNCGRVKLWTERKSGSVVEIELSSWRSVIVMSERSCPSAT